MKTWRSREELAAQVVTLHVSKLSIRAIARSVRVSRNTVRKLLRTHQKARDDETPAHPEVSRVPRATKLDAHRGKVADLLERYPDITAQRIFEDLCAAGYDGGLTAVKECVRLTRPPTPPTPSMPVEQSGPAEMAECDWSPYTIDFTHSGRCTVQAFGYILTYSTRKHFAFFERSDIYALMDGHTATFERFGGAAHACKYDSQKAVVLGWEGNQPIYNPRFLAFSTHYESRPVACRVRKPNDKPRVERSFWELERSFFNGRTFRDMADLRAQLLRWEDTIADLRPRKQAPKRPRMELFAEEQPLLRPLPRHHYDTARVVYRLCSIDGFISWDGNHYAVPYEHITDILPVRVTQNEVLIYAADLRCVARHELVPKGGGEQIGASRYHPRPFASRGTGASLDQLRVTFDGMGGPASAWLEMLCTKNPKVAGYHARRVLLLRERWSTDDLCAALAHALQYGVQEHKAVERILLARSRPRRLAEYVSEDLARRLANNLGVIETAPRDLTEYDRLPASSKAPAQEDKP